MPQLGKVDRVLHRPANTISWPPILKVNKVARSFKSNHSKHHKLPAVGFQAKLTRRWLYGWRPQTPRPRGNLFQGSESPFDRSLTFPGDAKVLAEKSRLCARPQFTSLTQDKHNISLSKEQIGIAGSLVKFSRRPTLFHLKRNKLP